MVIKEFRKAGVTTYGPIANRDRSHDKALEQVARHGGMVVISTKYNVEELVDKVCVAVRAMRLEEKLLVEQCYIGVRITRRPGVKK